MEVTAITQQIKNPNRYSIFIDGEYEFSLSADALLDSGLSRGQILTEADIKSFQKLSFDDKAYALTLSYIARRMRSEGELKLYFMKKGYDADLSEHILSRLTKRGYVNDEEFARQWVENRRTFKLSSTKKIKAELLQKHVRADIIDRALSQDSSSTRDVLAQLIEKKQRIPQYQQRDRLIAYLARQGFAYEDIIALLDKSIG